MNNPTLAVTSITVLNNYLQIEATITEPGAKAGRSVQYLYPKTTTNFAIVEHVQTGPKGTPIYAKFYQISNHMTAGRLEIDELLVGNITNGPKGTPFTALTFLDFMTKNTGV